MDEPTTNVDVCRACGGPGLSAEGARCERCQGVWVSALALLDLVADAAHAPLGSLPWVDRTRPVTRTCEVCAGPMRAVSLYRTALDRCDAHGIWLDVHELERVLAEAPRHHAPFVPPPPRTGLTDEQRELVGTVLVGDPLASSEARQDGLLGVLFKLFG